MRGDILTDHIFEKTINVRLYEMSKCITSISKTIFERKDRTSR